MSKPSTPPLTNSAARITRNPKPPARQVNTSQRSMDGPLRPKEPSWGQSVTKKR